MRNFDILDPAAALPPQSTAEDPNADDLSGIETHDPNTGRPRKQSDILIDIGRRHCLFHTDDGSAYVRAGKAVHAIESTAYKERLAGAYFDLVGKGCNRNALSDAVTTLSARAKRQGAEHPVWIRTAMAGDVIHLDPGWPDWRVIEITAAGWRFVESGPMFLRPKAFRPMAAPSNTPNFSLIWRHLPVATEHRVLIAAYILAALRPGYPCPILLFSGEQGTGKSTAAKMLRSLIDPSASPLRAPPKDVRDLLVSGFNSWVLSLDNLSHLSPELSDALCRITTGGSISERQLYTNTDEVLVQLQRPIVANGIEDVATRPDLVERCIHIVLDPLPHRAPERTLMTAFEADLPHILAGLLAALSSALRCYSGITFDLPRMADFAQFAAAGLPELGFDAEGFLATYKANVDEGLAAGVDTSPVARAVLAFMDTRTEWTGITATLLDELNLRRESHQVRDQSWPRTPRALAGTLRRLAPALRRHGVDVTHRRTTHARTLTLCKVSEQPSLVSYRHAKSPSMGESRACVPVADDGLDADTVMPSVMQRCAGIGAEQPQAVAGGLNTIRPDGHDADDGHDGRESLLHDPTVHDAAFSPNGADGEDAEL